MQDVDVGAIDLNKLSLVSARLKNNVLLYLSLQTEISPYYDLLYH